MAASDFTTTILINQAPQEVFNARVKIFLHPKNSYPIIYPKASEM